MADEQMGAPAAAADGSATASGTTAAPATDAATQQETPEQKIARLEQEAAEARAAEKRERDLRLSHQSTVEEARRALQDRAATTPTPADPLAQWVSDADREIAALEAHLQKYDDPAASAALRSARATKALVIREVQEAGRQREYEQARPVFVADARHGTRAEQLWLEGRARTPQDALVMARGEAAQNEEAERQKADSLAAARGQGRPSTSAAGSVGSESRSPTKMTNAAYLARVRNGDWRLIQQRGRGEVVVEG